MPWASSLYKEGGIKISQGKAQLCGIDNIPLETGVLFLGLNATWT